MLPDVTGAIRAVLLLGVMAGAAVAGEAVVGEPAPDDIAAWIGLEVPPYPDGLADGGGACIPGAAGIEHVCDYGVGVLRDVQGNDRYLVAEQSLGHGPAGRARWMLLDMLPYPSLPEGYGLTIGLCELDGRPAPSLVAIVDMSHDVEWFSAVDKAWRLDFVRKRWVEIGPAGIRCLNEGYGYDG